MTTENTTTAEINLDFRHLQAELARIDLFIRREVWRWQLAGQDPTDAFRGLYVSDAEVEGMLNRAICSNWGQTVTLPPTEAQALLEAEAQAEAEIQAVVALAKEQNKTLPLLALASAFDLSRFELDVLLICLAPSLDLRYEKLYAYLQDDVTRKRPSVNLTLDLLGLTGPARLQKLVYFEEPAPLRRYQLLDLVSEARPPHGPLLSQTLRVDETVVAWLRGSYRPHADLGQQARLIQPEPPNAVDRLLAGDAGDHLAHFTTTDEPPLIVFHGPDQVRQQAAARLLAASLGRPLLPVDLAGLIQDEVPAGRVLTATLRDARLTGAIPCLTGWDACMTTEDTVPPALLAELCAYPDLIILAGSKRWQAQGNETQRHIFWREFPAPTYAQRLKLWPHFLTEKEIHRLPGAQMDTDKSKREKNICVHLCPSVDFTNLAGQFALTTGQIHDAVTSARSQAAQRGEPLTEQDLFLAARSHSNPRLAVLARKITPRYTWQDIILPDDQLRMLGEIVETVRGRSLVLEQWGVGHKLASSAAVTVLFAGDPGTGKTMAAEVIATELKLDLYKIDLSTVVSKYIGETEKNLEKIFSEAESSNAILFFDEADAIFGKRSEVKDAHDRYANIEVSYLLQRMEAYNGITILATNLRANLDEAFTRRLQFIVDFPFPDPADRLRIWQTLFPPDLPRAPNLDFAALAERHKLAGGNIRNIIVSAAYQAAANGGQVTMAHVWHGTRRELQKMGRLVGEGVFGD